MVIEPQSLLTLFITKAPVKTGKEHEPGHKKLHLCRLSGLWAQVFKLRLQ